MIKDYDTIIFDCDGVILDSNQIKTNAFEKISSSYGKEISRKLVEFHLANGGVSRFHKIAYLKEILEKSSNVSFSEKRHLIEFGKIVKTALLSCKICDGLSDIRGDNLHQRWLVVSGSEESELNEIFKNRDISKHFDGGIFGSPRNKYEIITFNLKKKNIFGKILFIGDSLYDKNVADFFGFDFVFMSKWSECEELKAMSDKGLINSYPDIPALFCENVKE